MDEVRDVKLCRARYIIGDLGDALQVRFRGCVL